MLIEAAKHTHMSDVFAQEAFAIWQVLFYLITGWTTYYVQNHVVYCRMLPFEVVILYLPIRVLAFNHVIKYPNLGPILESTIEI